MKSKTRLKRFSSRMNFEGNIKRERNSVLKLEFACFYKLGISAENNGASDAVNVGDLPSLAIRSAW